MNMIFFSHGRTALKYGLIHHGLGDNNSILIPNYICDSIVSPLYELQIKPIFYRIRDNMKPDWKDLKQKIDHNVNAILIVHYFGQAQNIEKIIKFCKTYNLIFIEDNAHGHGGKYNGKYLGSFGDIGFSSPRKFFPIDFGGGLFLKSDHKFNITLPQPHFNDKIKKIIKRKIKLFPFIKRLDRKPPLYFNPIDHSQEKIRDMIIDHNSLKVLNNIDIDEYRANRIVLYKFWENFSLIHGLKPVFQKFNSDCMPWVFPAYASSFDERNKWLEWGYKNNINLFTWPRLPDKVSKKHEVSNRWNRLLCFPIESWMDPAKLEKYLFNEK